jgi:hypothetical protein
MGGIAALGTYQQALQEIAAAFFWDPRAPAILSQLRLHCLKQGWIDQRRDGDGAPRLWRGLPPGVPTSRVGGSAAWRTEAWADGCPARFAVGRFTLVGGGF